MNIDNMIKNLIMKNLFVATFLLIGIQGMSAQQGSFTNDKSLYEKIVNIEKKTDNFNFYLNMQGGFDATFNKNEFEQGNFNMRQFRIEARGNVNQWLSYRWRQRLNRPNNHHLTIDNMPTSIDIAGIGVNLSDKFSMFVGKQCAAYGGIEFDLNPIEIYEYSDMIENMSNFLTGVTFAYDATSNHQLQLQILNGLNDKFENTYHAEGIEKSKLPLVYTINWNGSLFDGFYKTRWSASLMRQAKKQNMLYWAFGNEFNFSRKTNMFFDVMYSREGLDRKGIMSSMLSGGTSNAFDAEYLSLVAKLNYRFQPRWNVFVEGMYETASLSKAYDMFEAGKYRTSYGYLTGIEYYPMNTNLHFFLTYIGRSYNYENKADMSDYNTHRIATGFIYQLPMF